MRSVMFAFVAALLFWFAAGEAFGQQQDERAEGAGIQLLFPDNVQLKTVIDYVATRLRQNIIYEDSAVSKPITIRSPTTVTEDELLAILRSSLRFAGLALVDAEQPGWLQVIADQKLQQSASIGLLQAPGAGRSGATTRLVRLSHIGTHDFAAAIEFLLSKPGGNIQHLPTGDAFIITDYASVIQAVDKLKKRLDVPQLARRWQVRRIEHAPVERLANDLRPLVQQALSKFRTADGKEIQAAQMISVLASLNALLISGTEEQVAQIEAPVQLLRGSRGGAGVDR